MKRGKKCEGAQNGEEKEKTREETSLKLPRCVPHSDQMKRRLSKLVSLGNNRWLALSISGSNN